MTENDYGAVVVTGGASGLGEATALLLAKQGRPVAVWDIDGDGAARTAARCGEAGGVRAVSAAVDVAQSPSVSVAAEAAREALGPISGLACCAGVMRMGDIDAISGEDWRVSMLVNVEGALNCLRALLPSLRDAGRTSSVVIVSSTEGLRGAPFHVAYTTSKHAVVGLVRSASKSLGADGIRVNVVCPGTMDTPMFRNAMSTAPQGTREAVEAATALGYVAEPVEIGRVIAFLLSTDASYVTGATIVVDGGLLAI